MKNFKLMIAITAVLLNSFFYGSEKHHEILHDRWQLTSQKTDIHGGQTTVQKNDFEDIVKTEYYRQATEENEIGLYTLTEVKNGKKIKELHQETVLDLKGNVDSITTEETHFNFDGSKKMMTRVVEYFEPTYKKEKTTWYYDRPGAAPRVVRG